MTCSNWLSVLGLGTSVSLVDKGERMTIASVSEEGERDSSSGTGGVIGWEGSWKKSVGRG